MNRPPTGNELFQLTHKKITWLNYDFQNLKSFLWQLKKEKSDLLDLLLNIKYKFHFGSDSFIWFPHFFFIPPSDEWNEWYGFGWTFLFYFLFWEFRIEKRSTVFYLDEAHDFGNNKWKYYNCADDKWYWVGTKTV